MKPKMRLLLIACAIATCSVTASKADCASDLDAIVQSMLQSGPYHMSTSLVSDGQTTSIEADVNFPTAAHIITEQMEMIILPEGMWMKQGGVWQSAPGAGGATMMSTIMSTFKDTRSNIVCGAQGTFDGQSYPVFAYDSSGEAMGIDTTSHVTMYLGDNGLPVVMVVDGTAMGVHSVTTQRIRYDASITITAPQ